MLLNIASIENLLHGTSSIHHDEDDAIIIMATSSFFVVGEIGRYI